MNEVLKNLTPGQVDALIGCVFCFGMAFLAAAVGVVALVLNHFENKRN